MLIETDTTTAQELCGILELRTRSFVMAYTGDDESGEFYHVVCKKGHLMESLGLAETLRDRIKELIHEMKTQEDEG